jgi:hypothetical protein
VAQDVGPVFKPQYHKKKKKKKTLRAVLKHFVEFSGPEAVKGLLEIDSINLKLANMLPCC